MKVLVILLLPVILGLFLGSILSVNPAFGFTCARTNMTGHFEETDAIFLGKALSKEYQPNPRHEDMPDEVYLFSIIEPYKGIYQEKIKVTSSVWDWGVNFTENSNYVVFANNNKGNLKHALCTPTQLASESNLSEIRKISQNYILPPLSQIDFGVNPNEIECKQNLVLIQKYDGSPACVTEPTKLKLIERGWTTKDSSAQKIIERIKQDTQAVNEVDARYIETLVLMNQTVSNFVYGVEWTSHCCGYFENNNSSEITITFLDSDNQKQLGVTFDLDTMQITDIQQSNTVSIGKGLSSEPDPYRLIALREFPNESSYYHKINNISEIPYISKINENKTTITTSEQFNELLGWFPQKCLENNSDSYDCSNTPPIFEYDSTKYLIVSHGLDSNEVYCESGLLHITNYEKEFPDRNVEDFVPVKCVTPPTKDQLFDK